MNQALGQLANAPLIYVLAQIKFNKVPKMKDLSEDFHQRVFEIYPESEVEQITQFAIKKEEGEEGITPLQETRWHFLSRDKRMGILLLPDTLIFHTTSYETSSKFFENLAFALSSLIEVIPKGVQTKRLGLRYVDLLLPQSNLEVDKQVADKLGMLNLESVGCKPVRFERMASYTTDIGGELKLRTRQTIGKDVLPSDLFPNILQPAPLLSRGKIKEDSIVGLLDFDHFLLLETDLETESVVSKFRDLQKTTSAAFRAVTTSDAMSTWQEEQ